MRIIRTPGQHPALGDFFGCQQLPWFRLSIMALAGLVGVISFAFPETSSPAVRTQVPRSGFGLTTTRKPHPPC